MVKKVRKSDVKKDAAASGEVADKAAKGKKPKFVLVGAGSYVVFGPFSLGKAKAYLKERNFVHGKGDAWSNAEKGAKIFLKEVKRPPMLPRKDLSETLLRPDGL